LFVHRTRVGVVGYKSIQDLHCILGHLMISQGLLPGFFPLSSAAPTLSFSFTHLKPSLPSSLPYNGLVLFA